MIKVTFDGVEYTKASHVAKEFGYTSDYIGQLCRAKKVNARLVGRSWFVNVPSLEAHREGRYQLQKQGKVVNKIDVSEELTVQSADQENNNKKYLRRVPAPEFGMKKITHRHQTDTGELRHASVTYEADDHSLLPQIKTAPKVTLLKVGIADAEQIKVQSETRKRSQLAPQPLPDVALSGTLSVSEISDEEYEQATTKAEKEVAAGTEVSPTRDNHKNKVKIKKLDIEKQPKNSLEESLDKKEVAKLESENTAKVSRKSPDIQVDKTHKSQVHLSEPVDHYEVPIAVLDTEVKKVRIDYRMPALGVVSGVLVGLLVLTAEQTGFATSEFVDFDITFVWSNIKNVALVLFTG